jgi:hypothetical protein
MNADASVQRFLKHAFDAFVIGSGLERIFSQSMGESERRNTSDQLSVRRFFTLVGGERNGGACKSELSAMSVDA